MIIPLVTFVAFFGLIYTAYWAFVLKPEAEVAGTVRRRLKKGHAQSVRRAELLKQVQAMSAIGPIDAFLKRSDSHTKKIQLLIEQSGMKITVGTLLAATLAVSMVAFYVTMRVGLWVSVAFAAAALASLIPIAVVRFQRTLRMRKFEEQFPEALDLLGRALRAGHAFTTGLEMVAKEMADPIGPEFRILFDQQNYGMPLPDALRLFAEHIPLIDARFFVTAVLIQREAGGNLSEVLDNLAQVMRERFRVKRQIRVISAHGRITGWVLVCVPPVLALVLFTINGETRELMFGDPLGQNMLIGAGVLQVIGALIIRKIINVEY